MAKTKKFACSRDALIALFTALEFKGASRWKKEKMIETIQTLPDVVDEDTDAGDSQELLDQLLEAIDNEADIDITAKPEEPAKEAKPAKADKAKGKPAKAAEPEEDEDEEEDGDEDEEESDESDDEESDEDEDESDDEEESVPVKKKKDKADKKKGDKKPRESAAKDAFGCREGSQAAIINKAVSKKGKTAAEIAEETDLKSFRVKSHLAAMIKKGHVKLTKDDKYILAGKDKEAK